MKSNKRKIVRLLKFLNRKTLPSYWCAAKLLQRMHGGGDRASYQSDFFGITSKQLREQGGTYSPHYLIKIRGFTHWPEKDMRLAGDLPLHVALRIGWFYCQAALVPAASSDKGLLRKSARKLTKRYWKRKGSTALWAKAVSEERRRFLRILPSGGISRLVALRFEATHLSLKRLSNDFKELGKLTQRHNALRRSLGKDIATLSRLAHRIRNQFNELDTRRRELLRKKDI